MPRNLIVLILILALGANGCCTGASGDDLGFVGEAPASVAGIGAEVSDVQDALTQLMSQRVYDTGMYMQWTCSKSNKSKLRNGPAQTYFAGQGYEQPARISGSGEGQGDYYTLQFALPAGQLTVKFVYDHAQHLIYDVRVRSAPQASDTAIPADCTFTGMLAGQAVDLTFQQAIRGIRLDTFQGGPSSGFW